ncbi:hypothetical protein TIFTF001_031212 [Ficus carica]|uniref:Uncharacterized protein n=1 Tax=Ficus carica TaxID=3494 RepID=A0AA88E0L3_FICCA|nr:hypothetical protein TIFTF001_031212 [Ficus carica]
MAHYPVFAELNSDWRLVALFGGTSSCDHSRDGIRQVTTPSLAGTLAYQLVAALDDLSEETNNILDTLHSPHRFREWGNELGRKVDTLG